MIKELLKTQKIIVLDGASGTELERKGYDINDSLWSAKFLMQDHKAISDIHEDYLNAGADCITTLSYQASYEGFMNLGLSEKEAAALIKTSVSLAKKARDDFYIRNKASKKALVAASVGPYGAYLANGSEFTGLYDLDEQELVCFHKKRMKTLLDEKPDILACETVPCLKEAKAYVTLLKEFPKACAWISFSAKDYTHISSGESIKQCAQFLDDKEQIQAIGINCTDPKYIESLIKEIKEVTNKAIIVYPNGGASYDSHSKTWSKEVKDNDYEQRAKLWYDKGASIIGGCCQTTPNDIKSIVKYFKN